MEKLGQDEADYMEKLFALQILDLYGTMKTRRLSKREREIAATINDLAQRLHAPKDAEDIMEDEQENHG